MLLKISIFLIIGFVFPLCAEHAVGWSNGPAYRYQYKSYIFELGVLPFGNHNRNDEEISGSNAGKTHEHIFRLDNFIYIGKKILKIKNIGLNSGVAVGHEYRWTDRKFSSSNGNNRRNWTETNNFDFRILISPSIKIFNRIILETDYGAEYSIGSVKNYSESTSYLVLNQQVTPLTTLGEVNQKNYRIIGGPISLNTGFKLLFLI